MSCLESIWVWVWAVCSVAMVRRRCRLGLITSNSLVAGNRLGKRREVVAWFAGHAYNAINFCIGASEGWYELVHAINGWIGAGF